MERTAEKQIKLALLLAPLESGTFMISMFAGVVFLHEPFGVFSLAASAMIILGVWKVQTTGTK